MTLPPIQCPHCGGALKTEPGQLVGDPAAIDAVKAMREALEAWDQWWLDRLADPDLPAPVPQTTAALRASAGMSETHAPEEDT